MTDYKRKQWIDISRGIGILAVLLAHSCGIPGILGKLILSCYMPMFFILSGYTFNEKRTCREFLSIRIRRLLIPYAFYSVVCLLISNVLKVLTSGVTLRSLWFDIFGCIYSRYSLYPLSVDENIYFLSNANSPLWFLTALFTSSLFFAFLYYRKKKAVKIAIIILYIAVGSVAVNLPVLLPWSIETSLLGAVFIVIGLLFKKYNIVNIDRRSWTIYVLLVGVYGILVSFISSVNMSVRDYGSDSSWGGVLFILIGCIGSLLIFAASKLMENHNVGKIIAYFGRNSMALMCIHMIVFRIISTLGDYLELNRYVLAIPQIGFAVIALAVWKYLLTRVKNKLPIVSYL